MAYWPTSGHTLDSINYSRCSVGIIQFFVSNTVKFQEDSTSSRVQEHLFCGVETKPSTNMTVRNCIIYAQLD